ncbi:bis(5'-nucleosyl)-tetraphosphatase PrpE [uncultured Caudovirales phage]|uniref:Bis(5'-nucleosyl)-tetraphosphatase PrpE n=1 Tax=uncultured Caudovirales phage TaxID=2100421 RepID=A0A6J5RTR6_9CAUD|nr:bis(5'-nucleosyl)-tetraphosphatase PrpE [uncultured Caudovirales phage]
MKDKLRTILIGDIHGCIEEFNELLNKLSYNKNTDRLILLGDLIDRGPDSVAVVKKARELDLECVMGNHEHKFLKWNNNRGSSNDVYDKKPHYNDFSDEDINYIFRMPTYIKLDNIIVVHAGLKPGISISSQLKDDLMYLRYTDLDRKFISLKKISKIGKEKAGAIFWTEFWYGPESVIYGHSVHSMETPLIEEVASGVICYGLDTGCCFGGHLSALILETKEIIQVKAKQKYYESRLAI